MEVSEARRLRQLEAENRQLKHAVVELLLVAYQVDLPPIFSPLWPLLALLAEKYVFFRHDFLSFRVCCPPRFEIHCTIRCTIPPN
jgi:hypothetical protein